MAIFSILCACITLCITGCINPADLDAFLADEKVEEIVFFTGGSTSNGEHLPELGLLTNGTRRLLPPGEDIFMAASATVTIRLINEFFYNSYNWYFSPDFNASKGSGIEFVINATTLPANGSYGFYDLLLIVERNSVPYSRNVRIWVVD